MEHELYWAELDLMIKRACIWIVLGLIAGLIAQFGLPPVLTKIAQVVFYSCAGLTVLSLMFSLFEEADEPEVDHEPVTQIRP
jgi:uncharacterized membrane protein YtjA (UPF0391 family)